MRLFSVLLSTDIDVSLRKSAGGQLIIALRNRDVHSAVLEAGMVYKLVGMALELVEEDRKVRRFDRVIASFEKSLFVEWNNRFTSKCHKSSVSAFSGQCFGL